MDKLLKFLLAIAIIAIPLESFSLVQPFHKTDCALLSLPKTVLLVHASWCSHCKAFLPTFTKVSDQENYQDWTFYELQNDKFENVCGTAISGVPITFKNNMHTYLLGNRSQKSLEEFLDKP